MKSEYTYTATVKSESESTAVSSGRQAEPLRVCTGILVWRGAQGNLMTSMVSSTMTATEGYRNVGRL